MGRPIESIGITMVDSEWPHSMVDLQHRAVNVRRPVKSQYRALFSLKLVYLPNGSNYYYYGTQVDQKVMI